MSFDRGAFDMLMFRRCERGFTLTVHNMGSDRNIQWAFDCIGDLADWLEQQYENPPTDENLKKPGTGTA